MPLACVRVIKQGDNAGFRMTRAALYKQRLKKNPIEFGVHFFCIEFKQAQSPVSSPPDGGKSDCT